MSPEDITPEQHPAGETRQVTVEVPAHRVEQFERFHERFLRMAAHWDAQIGNEDLRGPRGRRGRGPPRRRSLPRPPGRRRARRLMADKPVTVEVPEDRVPEFYLWFAAFLASPPGSGPPRGGPRRGGPGPPWQPPRSPRLGRRRPRRRPLALRPAVRPRARAVRPAHRHAGRAALRQRGRHAPRAGQGRPRPRRHPRVAGSLVPQARAGLPDHDHGPRRRRDRLPHGPGDRGAVRPCARAAAR